MSVAASMEDVISTVDLDPETKNMVEEFKKVFENEQAPLEKETDTISAPPSTPVEDKEEEDIPENKSETNIEINEKPRIYEAKFNLSLEDILTYGVIGLTVLFYLACRYPEILQFFIGAMLLSVMVVFITINPEKAFECVRSLLYLTTFTMH